MNGKARSRYSSIAIALHWAIALAILLMIYVGWWMTENVDNAALAAPVFKAYQFHKSLGLAILLLTLLRLAWRLGHRPPALPATMTALARAAARALHGALYALMLAMPLSGWAYVSAGWNADRNIPFPVPTIWFGLFQWPHIPGIATLETGARAAFAGFAMEAHEWLAWGALALIAVHVAAALKHHFIDRDDILARMLPLARPRRPKEDRL